MDTKPPQIDVAVCTYRRAALFADCMDAIARQDLPAGARLRIVVADNNPTPLMRGEAARMQQRTGVEIAYVHAPKANISIARNACLDAATGDWLVFIDDDEIAGHGWLNHLMARAGETGADIVFGVSEPILPQSAPSWSRSGEFHANRLTGNDQPHNGYTCNVAMRRAALGPLRFAEPLGTTGGEDTLFFHQARAQGLSFAYAPDAVVREHIPESRVRIGWVLRRRYRSGQTHHMLCRDRERAGRIAIPALAKATWCLGVAAALALPAVAFAPLRGVAVRWLARGALHGGVVMAALGHAPLQEYRAVPPASPSLAV